jgi:hypothetical protein
LEETRNNAQIEADAKLAIEADLQQKLRDLDDQTLDVSVKNAQAELAAGKAKDDDLKASAELRAQSEIDAIKTF